MNFVMWGQMINCNGVAGPVGDKIVCILTDTLAFSLFVLVF